MVTPSLYDAGTHEPVNFVLQNPSALKFQIIFYKIIIDNKIKEGFRHMEFWLIRKLLNLLHLILELQYILEDPTNKTYHCALK